MLAMIGVPVAALLCGSGVLFHKERTVWSFLQLAGAACLMLMVLCHAFEAFQLLTLMRWGDPDSAGHYLDLASAAIGLTTFPVGYLAYALSARRAAATHSKPE
jgi:hypothetical protein